mmetsp:Transcript_5830/g.24100  ORF Transcript_5830/g.24100 Transcript_5830/m.24100 type:complete len:590 (+) Transcript_5830:809-2578(+)
MRDAQRRRRRRRRAASRRITSQTPAVQRHPDPRRDGAADGRRRRRHRVLRVPGPRRDVQRVPEMIVRPIDPVPNPGARERRGIVRAKPRVDAASGPHRRRYAPRLPAPARRRGDADDGSKPARAPTAAGRAAPSSREGLAERKHDGVAAAFRHRSGSHRADRGRRAYAVDERRPIVRGRRRGLAVAFPVGRVPVGGRERLVEGRRDPRRSEKGRRRRNRHRLERGGRIRARRRLAPNQRGAHPRAVADVHHDPPAAARGTERARQCTHRESIKVDKVGAGDERDGPSARQSRIRSRRRRLRSFRHHHLPTDAPGDELRVRDAVTGSAVERYDARDPRHVDDGESRAEKERAVAGRGESIAESVERGVVVAMMRRDVRRGVNDGAAHDAPHAARESPRRRLRGGERDGNERGVARDDAHLLIDDRRGDDAGLDEQGSVAWRRRRLGRRVGEFGRVFVPVSGLVPDGIGEASGERGEGERVGSRRARGGDASDAPSRRPGRVKPRTRTRGSARHGADGSHAAPPADPAGGVRGGGRSGGRRRRRGRGRGRAGRRRRRRRRGRRPGNRRAGGRGRRRGRVRGCNPGRETRGL